MTEPAAQPTARERLAQTKERLNAIKGRVKTILDDVRARDAATTDKQEPHEQV